MLGNIFKEAQIAVYSALLYEIGRQRHRRLVHSTGSQCRTVKTIYS